MQQGGRKYRAFNPKMTVQDTLCIYQDKQTFCKHLASCLDKVVSVQLYNTVDEKTILQTEKAQEFLIMLTKSSNNTTTVTFTNKTPFVNYLNNIQEVKHIVDETYHPFVPIVKGKPKDVIGFCMEFKEGKHTYHAFQQTCDEYLDNMSLTQAQYTKMLVDISSVIEKVNRKGFLINGISHHTIGYHKSSGTFKILDWQYLNTIASKKHNGYMLYSHPLKTYLNGSTSVLAKRNIALGTLLPKNKWVRKLKSYKAIRAYSKTSFIYIIETYKKKDLPKFVSQFDKWSIALLAVFLADRHEVKLAVDMVNKWLSAFTPNVQTDISNFLSK